MTINLKMQSELLSGWGRTNPVQCKVVKPINVAQVQELILNANPYSTITRGLGRSYGDAALLKDGTVIQIPSFENVEINSELGFVTAGAGASLDKILKLIVPQGYFLPVSPGTKFVTVGGAIASDVHGKNHHIDGSFGNHLRYIMLVDGHGELHKLKPDPNLKNDKKDLFWATVGGMGLTGVIVEASFNIIKIDTSLMSVNTSCFKHIDELMEKMIDSDKKYRYSVAWIDSLDKNFRGILTCGNHATIDELPKDSKEDLLFYDPKSLISTPPFMPNGLLNKFTVKAFNQAWYRRASFRKKIELQTISEFFHPLDGINNWNRIYGSDGFIQYQFVVPDSSVKIITWTLEKLRRAGAPSFLNVLKRFGPSNLSPLSFPIEGWTLAIDIPANFKGLMSILDEIDNKVISSGGRIYLAKDSRQSSQSLKNSYTKLRNWYSIRENFDKNNIFVSSLALRCNLISNKSNLA